MQKQIEKFNPDIITRYICQKSFWEFEKYLNPDFFKEDRKYLKTIADALQALYEGKLLKENGQPYKKLMLNMPPRKGKTFTLANFCPWLLGVNPAEKILTTSYNETLSIRYSKSVRDTIEQTRLDGTKGVYSDIFPDNKIKFGDAAAQIWSLEGQYFSYLGSSFKGTLTGFGGSVGIIDDPIKSRDDAYNERVKEEQYLWYKDTFLSRLEEGSIQIINMTRWATNDLCGRILEDQPGEWYQLVFEEMDSNGKMLCPELMSRESYEDKKATTSKEIFFANYHQQPMDIEGRLYKTLKTYKELPFGAVKNYTDTADEGNCYLCSICYIEHNKEAYIVDVLYTGAGMEITEGKTAEMLLKTGTNLAMIESNNGGKGFARAVKRELQDRGDNRTVIKWFSQTKNKDARILSNSAWVQEHIYFPDDWDIRWPEFYKDVTMYTKDGKGQKKDAPDVLTGIAEQFGSYKLGFI